MSVTAFARALSAPLRAIVLPRADRSRVMLGLTPLAAVSKLVVALAPSFGVPDAVAIRPCSLLLTADAGATARANPERP